MLDHNHGKCRVRVLKVHRPKNPDGVHKVYEYTVATTLFNPDYGRVFTDEDNSGLVATDTQKNTVYVVAKRTKADSPEQFGVDLCRHLVNEYPVLTAVEADVEMTTWERAMVNGTPHVHGFEKRGPETARARVRIERDDEGVAKAPVVTSRIDRMTVLKTTNSGFEKYHKDRFTLLPETSERCLATELSCEWTYHPDFAHASSTTNDDEDDVALPDYASIRTKIRSNIVLGIFGPPDKGIYSASLQATIYDCACLVLKHAPQIWTVRIDTPNLHYLPMKALDVLGEKFEDDVFIPTNEPSGTITCTVGRVAN